MAKLKWDATGEKLYETGVRNGVLYKMKNGEYQEGIAWNGLTQVTESPSGAEPTDLYADDILYLSLLSAEKYAATIEAYMSPEEFDECDGTREIAPGLTISQQERVPFGFCYRTIIGNDTEKNEYGYKLHIIYGATASPSERSHQTVNESPEATTLSWEINTTPVNVEGYKPTATAEIDSTKVPESVMKQIEDILYGTDSDEARLPLPDELADILKNAVTPGT